MSLFCYALLCVQFSFAIIMKRNRKLVALLSLSFRCIVTTYTMWLFLVVPWVGLLYVMVVFPDHTHFFFFIVKYIICSKTLLQQGISEHIFYVDSVYKLKRIVGKHSFSGQFKKIIKRFKRV